MVSSSLTERFFCTLGPWTKFFERIKVLSKYNVSDYKRKITLIK